MKYITTSTLILLLAVSSSSLHAQDRNTYFKFEKLEVDVDFQVMRPMVKVTTNAQFNCEALVKIAFETRGTGTIQFLEVTESSSKGKVEQAAIETLKANAPRFTPETPNALSQGMFTYYGKNGCKRGS